MVDPNTRAHSGPDDTSIVGEFCSYSSGQHLNHASIIVVD